MESSSLGGEVDAAVERKLASDASSQVFRLPIDPGLKSFLARMDSPAALGHPFTHIEVEKVYPGSKTFSVPPVFTTADTPVGEIEGFTSATGGVVLVFD